MLPEGLQTFPISQHCRGWSPLLPRMAREQGELSLQSQSNCSPKCNTLFSLWHTEWHWAYEHRSCLLCWQFGVSLLDLLIGSQCNLSMIQVLCKFHTLGTMLPNHTSLQLHHSIPLTQYWQLYKAIPIPSRTPLQSWSSLHAFPMTFLGQWCRTAPPSQTNALWKCPTHPCHELLPPF
jgi:hypothetical protein